MYSRWSRGPRGRSRAVCRSASSAMAAESGTPGSTVTWPSRAALSSRYQDYCLCLRRFCFSIRTAFLCCALCSYTSVCSPAERQQAGSPAGSCAQASAQDPSPGHPPAEGRQRLVRPQQGEPPVSNGTLLMLAAIYFDKQLKKMADFAALYWCQCSITKKGYFKLIVTVWTTTQTYKKMGAKINVRILIEIKLHNVFVIMLINTTLALY